MTKLTKKEQQIADKICYIDTKTHSIIDFSGKKKNMLAYCSRYDDSVICFGEPDVVKALIKFGITEKLQANKKNATMTTLGFNPDKNKWYGWSHRALAGFGVGHVVKKGDCLEKIKPGFKCKTLADAKKVAADFAESVG